MQSIASLLIILQAEVLFKHLMKVSPKCLPNMGSNDKQRNDAKEAILTTLLYSDIFDFPLTKEELWRFLISERKIGKEEFERELKRLSKKKEIKNQESRIMEYQGYYCFLGRESFIKTRIRNLPEVEKKLALAEKTAYYLSHIPTIAFIGLSGGLAVEQAEKHDDIDFFIITKKKTLFLTRFLIFLLLEWMQIRRKRGSKQAENKICVNFLLDERELFWPQEKHDLYIAHEIVQMRPLFERQQLYKKFLKSNLWVSTFLPNSTDSKQVVVGETWHTDYYTLRCISNIF